MNDGHDFHYRRRGANQPSYLIFKKKTFYMDFSAVNSCQMFKKNGWMTEE